LATIFLLSEFGVYDQQIGLHTVYFQSYCVWFIFV